MKNLFNILAASLVTCLVLSSCGKVETPNNGTPGQKKEPRVISLAFASTRTTLGEDGYTPTFAVDDQIKISNGTGTDDCSVKYDATKGFYIETALEGPLTAVYPASAAEINGKNITGVLVPATQDGTFAKANICKAVQSGKDDELTFNNQTAILRFYVDESIGVTQLTISGTDVSSSGNSITVTPSPSSSSPKYGGPDDRICYVAISATASGTTYSTLTLTSVTTTQTAYANSTVTREISSVKLKQNEMYNAFIPYYIDLGDAGKWAYCNIGAFLPEETGDYFMWGEVNGHKRSDSNYRAFSNDFKKFDYNDKNRYTSSNDSNAGDPQFDNDYFAPYYDGQDYSDGRYNFSDGLTTLALEDDAANFNWKGGWRMPTYDEFQALISEVIYDCGDGTENLPFIIEMNSNSLFLPYSGFGSETNLLYDDTDYWTSSLISSGDDEDLEGPMHAYCLCFDHEEAYMTWCYRSSGYCIRPIFDASLLPGVDGISGTLDPMGKVDF